MILDGLILIYVVLGVLAFLLGFLIFQTLKLKKRLDIFLSSNNQSLENTLKDLLKRAKEGKKEIQEVSERTSSLEKTAQISLQKIGVVRYNPFRDVGGDQSFSIALLDSKNSGLVITSLYMREGTRVFAKPVIRGRSEYSLSEEEKEAIEQAMTSVS